MARILGLHGKFNKNHFDSLLKTLDYNDNIVNKKYSKGIFLSSKDITIFNNKFCNISLAGSEDSYFNIGFLSSNSSHLQPIKYKELVLIFDGVIYNTDEISSILLNTDVDDDNILIIKLLNKFYSNSNNLKESVEKTNNLINGDYTFAVFDGNNLAITRDSIGIRPLYYYDLNNNKNNNYNNKNNNNYNNNYNNNFCIFASQKKFLWKMGINDNDIKTLKPGHFLYNWEEFSPKYNQWNLEYNYKNYNKYYKKNFNNSYNILYNKNFNNIYKSCTVPYYKNYKKNKSNKRNIINKINKKNIINKINKNSYNCYNNNFNIDSYTSYDEIKYNLLKLIKNSTYDRIKGLSKVGLLFSGGVDSTILGTLLKKYKENHEIDIKLYTVGVKNSKDLKYSKKIAKNLNFPIKTMIIDENIVRSNLNTVVEAIEEINIMKIGVGMTMYLSSKLASNDDISTVLTGQGADELFAGYNRYLTTLKEKGEVALQKELIHDIKHSFELNLERDYKVADVNGIQLRIPFLDQRLVNYSLKIPIKYKINLDNDNNSNIDRKDNINKSDFLRKRILRDIAIDIGVDKKIATRPKKAAQYGSGIDKILRKKVLKNIDISKILVDIFDKYSIN